MSTDPHNALMHEKHYYCIYPFDPHHNQKHPTYLFLRQEEEEDKGGGEEEESSSKRKKKIQKKKTTI